jgi:transglutaminase-like putative cysteine protease
MWVRLFGGITARMGRHASRQPRPDAVEIPRQSRVDKRMTDRDHAQFLAPGAFVDSDAPAIVAFAQRTTAEAGDPRDAVLRLYGAIRDTITYDPYVDFTDPASYRASGVLAAGRGFCVGKAALLAAAARAIGVPARVGYADVRNHLTSPRLYRLIGTDVFTWHSYADILIDGNWVKATPAFDRALCERVGIDALAFDGQNDSLFHPFDRNGRQHMQYLRDRGTFADVPFETIQADFRRDYPNLMTGGRANGDFRAEAVAPTGE